jgi:phytanoyl-CoA hydroxylase
LIVCIFCAYFVELVLGACLVPELCEKQQLKNKTMIRRLKLAYMTYNLFNRSKLKHNERLYKALKLKKFYFSPISSKDFVGIDQSTLGKDKLVKEVSKTHLFDKLSKEDQQSLLNFEKEGYAILKQYVSKENVELINKEVDALINTGQLNFKYRNKIMFAYRKIEVLRKLASEEHLMELLSSLLFDDAKLFQSINFLMGSEQETHSDSIHMTTFPLGGLLGVWIALEDIEPDNGPLHYYPGSHKLPYYLNKDYDNEGSYLLTGDKDYSEYEKMIKGKINEFKLDKKVFTAKAGDLLIWHANLFHGGEVHANKQKTRKSVVLHYYAKNRICYHEITQRPALFE